MPGAYYNEIDPYAAQWLRNLIAAGHIAPGDVDERSIEDVRPSDLRGYTQCHFFAGIGVWSSALRLAGWSDERPVWTGSCPCQPFSAAGKGAGFADERHLWPAFHYLIEECRPAVVLGEQVASADANTWLDLVQADLEGLDFAFGALAFPSAGVGAPHIRDRAYWMGVANSFRGAVRRDIGAIRGATSANEDSTSNERRNGYALAHSSAASELAYSDDARPQGRCGMPERTDQCAIGPHGLAGGAADADRTSRQHAHVRTGQDDSVEAIRSGTLGGPFRQVAGGDEGESDGLHGITRGLSGPTNGFWRNPDWLLCRDGKWRPVESQPQPLVDGSAESLGLVRADIITALTEEINAAAMETKVIGAEAMRDLWDHLGTQAKRCWPSRGLPGLHEAPFLLAFVRQLASQGWLLAQGISLSRPEASRESLRGLRDNEALAGASHRRELDEQRSGERPDVVRVLSCILARHAQEAWGEAYKTYAAIGFPLSTGEPARVGRLRAYGNAINREAAAAFIAAADEAISLSA